MLNVNLFYIYFSLNLVWLPRKLLKKESTEMNLNLLKKELKKLNLTWLSNFLCSAKLSSGYCSLRTKMKNLKTKTYLFFDFHAF